MQCSICGKPMQEPYTANPEPLRNQEERCCHECDVLLVLPARMEQSRLSESEVSELKAMNYEQLCRRYRRFRAEGEKILTSNFYESDHSLD